jgi:hypothetical protein
VWITIRGGDTGEVKKSGKNLEHWKKVVIRTGDRVDCYPHTHNRVDNNLHPCKNLQFVSGGLTNRHKKTPTKSRGCLFKVVLVPSVLPKHHQTNLLRFPYKTHSPHRTR